MSDTNQDDFQAALATEFEYAPEPATPAEPAVADKEPVEEADPLNPPEPAAPEKTEEEKAAEAEAAKIASETEEETATRKAAEAVDDAVEEPKYATAEDVKKAMREIQAETTGRTEQLNSVRDDIIKSVHPEGIDTNIYDSNGLVIKTAQDIVDRQLINERTNEPYTYEEAASFMLEAGRQTAQNVEELNKWAESIAETNISLVESNKQVMEQWGDILKAMPELAKQLAETYITKQLEFDETGSYIKRMSMSPEEFYGVVMPAYRQLGEQLVKQNEAQATQAQQEQEAETQRKQNQQAERNGLPAQRGQSKVKANTGDPMIDALLDELDKG